MKNTTEETLDILFPIPVEQTIHEMKEELSEKDEE